MNEMRIPLLLLLLLVALCSRGTTIPADTCQIIADTNVEASAIGFEPEPEDSIVTQSLDLKTNPINFKDTKYWGRYTALRAAGWSCFGVGAGFFIGGYALLFASMITTNNDWADISGIAGGIMFFSSPIFVVASVPLLACAYYNRYKAKHLRLDAGVSFIPSDTFSPRRHSVPAFGLTLNF